MLHQKQQRMRQTDRSTNSLVSFHLTFRIFLHCLTPQLKEVTRLSIELQAVLSIMPSEKTISIYPNFIFHHLLEICMIQTSNICIASYNLTPQNCSLTTKINEFPENKQIYLQPNKTHSTLQDQCWQAFTWACCWTMWTLSLSLQVQQLSAVSNTGYSVQSII